MTDLEHLSNEELVSKFFNIMNPTWSEEEHNEKLALREEILRRLNEPWRKQKESEYPTLTKQDKMDMLEFVFEQGKRKGREEQDDK